MMGSWLDKETFMQKMAEAHEPVVTPDDPLESIAFIVMYVDDKFDAAINVRKHRETGIYQVGAQVWRKDKYRIHNAYVNTFERIDNILDDLYDVIHKAIELQMKVM